MRTTFSSNSADWGGAIDNGDTAGTGTLNIVSSTFTGNSVNTDGGAINNGDGGGTGTLSISGSTFSGDYANSDGGAIDSGDNGGTGTVAVTNSTFSGNSTGAHNGGAIDSGDNGGTGALTVAGSTLSGNASGAGTGGAINSGDASGTGTLNVRTSTFSANSASGSGGAIDSGDYGGTGNATVSSSTFSGNSALNFDGGAIDNGDDGGSASLILSASTFLGNSAGGSGATVTNGQDGGTGTVWAAADIFSGGCDQAAGTWDDEGYNVASDASCFAPTPASTDDDSAGTGLASLLGPLANNGGPTETVLPLPGNPGPVHRPRRHLCLTLDGTSATLCPTTDQRGVASEPGQACDAGSVQEGLARGAGPVVLYRGGDRAHRAGRDAPVRRGRLQPRRHLLDGRADRHGYRWHRSGPPRRLVHLYPDGWFRRHGHVSAIRSPTTSATYQPRRWSRSW